MIIVDKHRVHSTSKVAAVVKLEARNQLQSLRQGGFESIISYKQRYTNALKAYHDQGNPEKDDSDQAMDFFHGLDNGRYTEFKVQYLNGLQVGSIVAPKDLNTIFTLANNRLKPKALAGGGYASTYATRVDHVEKKQDGKKDAKSEKTGKDKDKKQGDANQPDGKDGKPKPKGKKLECFICGNEHYASNYPHKKKLKDEQGKESGDNGGDAFVNAAWEANVFATTKTYQVNAIGLSGFCAMEVLLDNQADISVMRPDMLRELRTLKDSVQVNGVGGVQMEVREAGYLDGFFEVYASDAVKVNILSFAEVQELYPITYEPHVGFTVHLTDKDILFRKRGKMHVADFGACGMSVMATQAYTKAEIERACRVQELIRNCGYPLYQELTYMLQDGNLTHLPNLTGQDVRRAYDLFGNSSEYVRGRMTRKPVKKAIVDDDLKMDEKKQELHSDVMHVDGQRFLVTVCEPLQLTVQVAVQRESQATIGPALQGQLELLRSKGFQPVRVYIDPQSALRSMATKFENIEIDVGGAGDYVPKVDAKIRRIKERYRSIKDGLPWKLPPAMVKDLVTYVVSRINIERSAATRAWLQRCSLRECEWIFARSLAWHLEITVKCMMVPITPLDLGVCFVWLCIHAITLQVHGPL